MTAAELELQTARLILRPLRMEDFEPWAATMADSEAARFIGGLQVRAVAWGGFMTMGGAWRLRGFAMFSVIERTTERWHGRLGPWHPEGWPGPEIGCVIIRQCWGRGYATEGSAATMDWVFRVGARYFTALRPTTSPRRWLACKLGSSNRGPGRLPAPFETTRIDIRTQTRAQ